MACLPCKEKKLTSLICAGRRGSPPTAAFLQEVRFNFEHLVNFRPRGLLFGVKEYTILYENKTERARGAEPVRRAPAGRGEIQHGKISDRERQLL